MTTNTQINPDTLMIENHHLIEDFLRLRRLEAAEFYDVVVFGYMEAARRWANKPELREQHSFQAVAYRKMKDSMSDYYQKQRAQKRVASVISLDLCENEALFDPFDTECGALDAMDFEAIMAVFDEQEQRILSLLMEGYPEKAIAERVGVSVKTVAGIRAEIKNKAGLLFLQPAAA